MCDHMAAQVAQVAEPCRALPAGIGFLSRVSPQMDLQASTMREAFLTLHAGVRLLPRVNAQVNVQRGLFEKGLPTIWTYEGVPADVSCPVGDQVFRTEEVPAAEAAINTLRDTRC